MSREVSTEIKCSDCGKSDRVSFKPIASKPVYCRECLAKHRSNRSAPGNQNRIQIQRPTNEKQAWSRRRENWK